MIKKIVFSIILCFLFLPVCLAEEKIDLYLFHGSGCPHCENEREFLEELKEKHDNLEVHLYEVWYNSENEDLMNLVKNALKTNQTGVPFTVIGKDYYIGYNLDTKDKIEKKVSNYTQEENVVQNIINDKSYYEKHEIGEEEQKEELVEDPITEEESSTFVFPIIGKVDGKKVSLPILAIVIGFVDGFNPCAMWVLLLLIGMLLGMKNRKRMWFLGLTFLTTSALVYLFFMFFWLGIAVQISQIIFVRNVIAIIALIAGTINLIKYVSKDKKEEGCDIVDDKKRKKYIKKIKQFTTEKSLFLAFCGVILLALSVNFVELACSAGLPLLFTQVLAINDLSRMQYILYICLYAFFFLIDDLVIFFIAMKSLKLKGFSQKYGNISHLIGGIIMVLIGVLLLVKPEWIMFNF